MSEIDLTAILSAAREAAAIGAAIVKRADLKDLELSTKSSAVDLVTKVDREVERAVFSLLKARFPKHQFLGEESATSLANSADYFGPLWVVDPIDGTTNFVHGVPFVGVAIGFTQNAIPMAGCVNAPYLNEEYWGVKGGGAYLNEHKISCSKRESLATALVASGFPYDKSLIAERTGILRAVLESCRDVRRLGAATLDLCGVASGRLDAYYEFDLRPWDIVAGSLIADEAGARVSRIHADPTGSKYPAEFPNYSVLAATPKIFEQLFRIVSRAKSADS